MPSPRSGISELTNLLTDEAKALEALRAAMASNRTAFVAIRAPNLESGISAMEPQWERLKSLERRRETIGAELSRELGLTGRVRVSKIIERAPVALGNRLRAAADAADQAARKIRAETLAGARLLRLSKQTHEGIVRSLAGEPTASHLGYDKKARATRHHRTRWTAGHWHGLARANAYNNTQRRRGHMSFGIGLGSGLRALAAARLGIETAGQNVANVNTPGYSRQRILQSSAFPQTLGNGLQVGTGVHVDEIRRQVDAGLERRLRTQFGVHGSAQVDFSRWSEIESVFNEPAGGLSNNFTDFFGSINKLQTQPASRALRGGVIQEGKTMASAINQVADRFKKIEESSFHEIDGHVKRVNELASTIAKLNDQIAVVEGRGSTANDLRDARDNQIREIGELMDVSVMERKSGATDILAGGLLLVAGNRASEMTTTRNSRGQTEIKMDGSDTPVRPGGGKIEGLLRHERFRDSTHPRATRRTVQESGTRIQSDPHDRRPLGRVLRSIPLCERRTGHQRKRRVR